ncbi:MAG: HAMP domain-containing histidine kinase, partial [Acidimicrobiia bacterium]|nr:HAMP domain-containing histidine kinase [Acidimicrobiia bacterium]
MSKKRALFHTARWAIGGALFGCVFVLIAWRVGVASVGNVTFDELHRQMPIMFIVDLAPTVLGIAGALLGTMYGRLHRAQARTQALAEEIAATWTADLQRANGELATALDQQQRLYSAVSHELRTPLTSIVGYTQLVETIDVAPVEASEYVHEIYRASSFLLQMVNELLEVAKLSKTGLTVALEDIDCCSVVENVVSLLRPLASASELGLVTQDSTGLECRADTVRLRQTMTNLIANAIKYSDGGTIVVRSARVGDSIEIEVVDQGRGIAPEDLERIFEPFTQTDDRDGTDSTGLGLVVSRILIDSMDGSLTAHSSG